MAIKLAALNSFLGGAAQGVGGGLDAVRQVQAISAEGKKQQAYQEMTDYAQRAAQDPNTDPMDQAQTMYALSLKAGDQQAAGQWFQHYDEMKKTKAQHSLYAAFAAANEDDLEGATNHYNQYATLSGQKTRASTFDGGLDPATSRPLTGVRLDRGPEGKPLTIAPGPDQKNHLRALLTIEALGPEKAMQLPMQQAESGARVAASEASTNRSNTLLPGEVTQQEATLEGTRAGTALVGEQIKYYAPEAQARIGSAEAGAAANYATAAHTREQTKFVAPQALAGIAASRAATGASLADTETENATRPYRVEGMQATNEQTRAGTATTNALREPQRLGAQANAITALAGSSVAVQGVPSAVQLGKSQADIARENATQERIETQYAPEEAQTQDRLRKAQANYYERDLTRTQEWDKNDQTSLDEALTNLSGLEQGLDGKLQQTRAPAPGFEVLSAKPGNLALAQSLAKGFMIANREKLRNNAEGALAIASAMLSKKGNYGLSRKAPGMVEYDAGGGDVYLLPAGQVPRTNRVPFAGP